MDQEEWVEVARSWGTLWDEHPHDADHYDSFVKANPGWDYTYWPSDLRRLNTTDDVIVKFYRIPPAKTGERGRPQEGRDFFVYFEASEDGPFWLLTDYSPTDPRHTIYPLVPYTGR